MMLTCECKALWKQMKDEEEEDQKPGSMVQEDSTTMTASESNDYDEDDNPLVWVPKSLSPSGRTRMESGV